MHEVKEISLSKNFLLFIDVYSVLLLLPVFALLTGSTDFEQMGFIIPSTLDLVIGNMVGLLSIPLTYYPMQAAMSKRNLMISWIKKAKHSFIAGVPFLLLGAFVEELFFRGFLITIISAFGALVAISISTVTHWLSHFINPNFKMFTDPFWKIIASGGFLITTLEIAIIFVYTKSLIPALTVHIMASLGFGLLISRKTQPRLRGL